jgi:DNA-binding transcriptional ArsR family regulator
MQTVLQALAEPRRREILRVIRGGELSSGQIASRFDVTRPAISQHLRVLENVGLVSVTRAGTRRLYRLRPEGFASLRAYLEQFWGESLDALKVAAEAQELEEARWKKTRRTRSRPPSGSGLAPRRSSRS